MSKEGIFGHSSDTATLFEPNLMRDCLLPRNRWDTGKLWGGRDVTLLIRQTVKRPARFMTVHRNPFQGRIIHESEDSLAERRGSAKEGVGVTVIRGMKSHEIKARSLTGAAELVPNNFQISCPKPSA